MFFFQKYRLSDERVTAFLVISAFVSTTLVLVPETYDSTFLKKPLLFFFSGIIVTTWFLRNFQYPALTLRITTLQAAFLLFLIASAISCYNAVQIHRAIEAILTATCYFMIFSGGTAFHDDKIEQKTYAIIICLAVLTSFVGMIQVLSTTPSALFFSTGTQEPISTFGNKSYFAGFITLILPVIAATGIVNKHRKFLSAGCAGLIVVLFFLLVKTESRASWIAAAIMFFLFFFMHYPAARKRWLTAAVAGASVLVLILLFSDTFSRRFTGLFDTSSTSTFSRRLLFYEGAWNAFLASPFVGNGTGNFGLFLPAFRSPDYWMTKSEDIVPHAHNEYLEILSETGVPGFIAFAGFLVLFYIYAIRSLRNLSGKKRTLFLGLLCGTTGVLIDGIASMNLRTVPVAFGFWFISGILTTYMNIPAFTMTLSFPSSFRIIARFIPALIVTGATVWYVPQVYHRYNAEREYLAGILYKYQGNVEAASLKFSETVRFNPEHSEARLYLAANMIEQKRFREGYQHLTALLTYDPYIPKGHLLRAVCAFELGNIKESDSEMETELKLTSNPQSLYYASFFARRINNLQKERDHLFLLLEKSIAGNVVDYIPMAVQRLGEICYSDVSAQCNTSVSKVTQQFPVVPSVIIAAAGFYSMTGDSTEAERLIFNGLNIPSLTGEQQQQLRQLRSKLRRNSE